MWKSHVPEENPPSHGNSTFSMGSTFTRKSHVHAEGVDGAGFHFGALRSEIPCIQWTAAWEGRAPAWAEEFGGKESRREESRRKEARRSVFGGSGMRAAWNFDGVAFGWSGIRADGIQADARERVPPVSHLDLGQRISGGRDCGRDKPVPFGKDGSWRFYEDAGGTRLARPVFAITSHDKHVFTRKSHFHREGTDEGISLRNVPK